MMITQHCVQYWNDHPLLLINSQSILKVFIIEILKVMKVLKVVVDHDSCVERSLSFLFLHNFLHFCSATKVMISIISRPQQLTL